MNIYSEGISIRIRVYGDPDPAIMLINIWIRVHNTVTTDKRSKLYIQKEIMIDNMDPDWCWVTNPDRCNQMPVRPSLPCFLPFIQNYLEAPIPKNSWPCKRFGCRCLYEKKSKNVVLPIPPPSEHFEISVQKPPMDGRVKNRISLKLKKISNLIFLHAYKDAYKVTLKDKK